MIMMNVPDSVSYVPASLPAVLWPSVGGVGQLVGARSGRWRPVSPVRFGQVVVGPPGSGKTTYCAGMAELLRGTGRPVALVNLDPANDTLPFAADLELAELVTVPDVMRELRLGPNGALLYCLEYLETNMDWLLRRLAALGDSYILFDFPGQVRRAPPG